MVPQVGQFRDTCRSNEHVGHVRSRSRSRLLHARTELAVDAVHAQRHGNREAHREQGVEPLQGHAVRLDRIGMHDVHVLQARDGQLVLVVLVAHSLTVFARMPVTAGAAGSCLLFHVTNSCQSPVARMAVTQHDPSPRT